MSKNRKVLLLLSLTASIIFFILGLYYPIMSTKQQILGLVLKQQDVRLFDSVRMFYASNDYLLALIIFTFTIVVPSMKYLDLLNRLLNLIRVSKTGNSILYHLDKWSMLDVFLVALLLLNFKMDSNIIVMKLEIGTSFITISIVIRMLSTLFINLKGRSL